MTDHTAEQTKTYNPLTDEAKIQEFWENEDVYKFNHETEKNIFSVDTPPPTVSGKMHIGHAFSYSQQDFLIRYKRMKGFEIFYPFGTDDNGLPTERLVEKMKNVRAKDMERPKFIKLCLDTLVDLRKKYLEDWKRIAISADFSIFYSTINPHCQKISQRSFVKLFKEGRIYQKESPTIWCPECQSSFAQVELEDIEMDSHFNDIVFKVGPGGKNDLIIATTRPEMLSACVAIFAHPDDKRYKKYFGKSAKVPLYDFEVPIIPDEKADPQKGTGIVMCCTFGDQTDIEWWYKHKLPLKISIGKDGKMTDASGKYAGMKIKDARKEIIKDLQDAGLLIAQKPIKHAVKVHERCGTEIEFLKTKQWFLRYLDLKEQFLESGAKLNWYPKYMKVRLDHWINGLQWDWCLSRQRFFGVPIPVWYCKECGTPKIADEDMLPVDPLNKMPKTECQCGSKNFVPEKDVFDTWATSSHTPDIACELFKGKKVYEKLFPMSLRPQAHDIITFWLFNTMVKSLLHHKKNPWKDVTISGFALDPHGKKMSKSKGNVVEPQLMISRYGADSLRFWAAGSKLGDDLPFQEKDLVTGKKMITKLWNASQFALMHMPEHYSPKSLSEINNEAGLLPVDKWLISKLQAVIKSCSDSFENYEYAKTKAEVENFFWHTFCDNYLEIIKGRLYNAEKYGPGSTDSIRATLYYSIYAMLRLLAPLMPHITEKIYQSYFRKYEKTKSIHLTHWPEFEKNFVDTFADEVGDILVDVIAGVRKFKSDNNLSLGKEIKQVIIECDSKQQRLLVETFDDLKNAVRAESIVFGKANSKATTCPETKIKVNVEI